MFKHRVSEAIVFRRLVTVRLGAVSQPCEARSRPLERCDRADRPLAFARLYGLTECFSRARCERRAHLLVSPADVRIRSGPGGERVAKVVNDEKTLKPSIVTIVLRRERRASM